MSTQILVCDKDLKVKIATLDNYNGEGLIDLPTKPLPSDATQTPILKQYSVFTRSIEGKTYLLAIRDNVIPDNIDDLIQKHQVEPYLE